MSEYAFLKRMKMSVHKLKLGMYVSELDKDWAESSFLLQGFVIDDEETLLKLKRECQYVYIEFRSQEHYDSFLQESDVEVDASIGDAELAFVEELPRALEIYKQTLKTNKLMIRKVQQGGILDLPEVEENVKDCIDSLKRNDRALIVATNIKNKIHYTAEHPTRVSILAIGLGLHLGMSQEQLQVFGMAATLHDIGKLMIPAKILNKPDRLDPEEAKLLKQHPQQSFKLLSQVEGISDVIREVALSHHEREDGTGYPRHIPKDRVSRYAKLVSIIDAYDAIISDRPYSKGQSPTHAFKLLHDGEGTKFDKQLVSSFIDWVGVMPLGSLVELETGEVGIVLKNYTDKKLRPKVMLVTDENKKSGLIEIVDISKKQRHSNQDEYRVRTVLANGTYGLNIERFLDSDKFGPSSWLQSKSQAKPSPFDKYID